MWSKTIAFALLLAGFAACGSTDSKALSVAEGFVLETETNRPIEGAYVTLFWYGRNRYAGWLEAEVVIKTDARGRFFHQSPIPNAEGWRSIVRAYKPGYQMFQFLEFDKKNLFRVVDKYDAEGLERTYAQMRELGYELEPVNKLTISGWVERRPIPDWFRRSQDESKLLTVYMEKANMRMNERIQEIAWTSQASTSVKQRIGPFLEYDRMRFEEATELVCFGTENMSTNTYEAIRQLLRDWQRRVHNDTTTFFELPAELVAEKKKLWDIRTANFGHGSERRLVFAPSDYRTLCKAGRYYLENEKS